MPFQRPHSPPMLPRLPAGYLLPEGKSMQDILRLDAELLAIEGVDPGWAEPEQKPADDEGGDSD